MKILKKYASYTKLDEIYDVDDPWLFLKECMKESSVVVEEATGIYNEADYVFKIYDDYIE